MIQTQALAGVFGDVREEDARRLRDLFGPPAMNHPALVAGATPCSAPSSALLAGTLYEGSAGDTSAFVRAWRRDGIAMLAPLRGDFTVLVWDDDTRSGVLARDQLGTGAVYYSARGRRLIFATELVTLLDLLPSRPAPDDQGVVHWLAAAASRPDLTMHEGVRQLEPGCCLHLEDDGWRVRRYWWPALVEGPRTRADAVDAVTPVLRRAVERRLDPAGTTGVLMSGGLDSAGVAGVARALRPGRVAAFSEVFPHHAEVDESAWIDHLTESLAIPGSRLAVRGVGLVAHAAATAGRFALPPVSFNFWNVPLLELAASQGSRVLLTGDGGDELFAIQPMAVADRLRRGRVTGALRLARAQPYALAHPPWPPVLSVLERAALGAAPSAADRLGDRLARDPFRRPWWLQPHAQAWLDDVAASPGAWKRLAASRARAAMLDRVMVRVPALGMFDDLRRLGRATGTELRAPLFDVDLLETVLSMDPALSAGPTMTKPVLRAGLRGLVPEAVRMRPLKTRFDPVLIGAVDGEDGPAIEALIGARDAALRRYVSPGAVRDLLASRPAPGMDAWRRAQVLWRLTALECWLRAEQAGGGTLFHLDRVRPANVAFPPDQRTGQDLSENQQGGKQPWRTTAARRTTASR